MTDLEGLMELADVAQKETQGNAMQTLSELAKEQIALEERVAKLTEQLSNAKKQLLKVSGELIPELMTQSGLSEVRLDSGQKVIIRKGLSVSYKKEDKFKLFEFLKEHNAGSLIKTKFDVGKLDDSVMDELFDFLDKKVGTYDTDQRVHPQTLEKFFRDLTAVNATDEERQKLYGEGKIMNIEELPEFLKVYTYSQTKIEL